MACKQCTRLKYQLKAFQYYSKLNEHNTDKISDSIMAYYKTNGVNHKQTYDVIEFMKFVLDNYGDYTIIKAVTGFD
jgi:hypothetical protein